MTKLGYQRFFDFPTKTDTSMHIMYREVKEQQASAIDKHALYPRIFRISIQKRHHAKRNVTQLRLL